MQILNGVLQEQFCTWVGTAKKKKFSLKKKKKFAGHVKSITVKVPIYFKKNWVPGWY